MADNKEMLSALFGVNAHDANALRQGKQLSGIGDIKVAKLHIVAAGKLATTVNDTGFDLPTKGIVLDCFVDATTVETTGTGKTLEVGLLASETGGDENGFIAAMSVATTAGVKTGAATYTDGTNQNYISANTIGALFFSGLVGGDAAGTSGAINRKWHILNGTAKSVTWTMSNNDWVEFVGDIYVVYMDFALV